MGHRKIAFLKGQPASSDSEERWQAISGVAQELGLVMDPDLIAYIETDDSSPLLGYPYAKQLLARKKPFTALFAYNDISALGAIRAIQEEGLRVPQDISVVGFDDIQWAAFNTPSLTTVRQPLVQMGRMAGETVIGMIEKSHEYSAEIVLKPTLVVRESTGPCAGQSRGRISLATGTASTRDMDNGTSRVPIFCDPWSITPRRSS